MELEHHDLAHDFPEFKNQIHALKTSNAHFAKLFEEYNQADREVRRIKQNVQLVTDVEAENAKKQCLALKDQLYIMLKAAA